MSRANSKPRTRVYTCSGWSDVAQLANDMRLRLNHADGRRVRRSARRDARMSELVDSFGRSVRYLRLSVTDRCDFRCVHCMAEEMTFQSRQLLTLEEMATLFRAVLRRYLVDTRRLKATIVAAMAQKPERHQFTTDGETQVVRFMNMTGG